MKEVKKLSSNDRFLIINADDFGMCHSANKAIMQMYKDGVITSSSLMPVCPWCEEAMEFAEETQVDIGVHLTFTSEWQYYKWGALTKGASLQEATGYMPSDCRSVEEFAKKEEVVKEMWSQIDKLREANLNITNIDNHMGSLYGLSMGRSFIPEIFDICQELDLPFRFPKNFPQERMVGMPEAIIQGCEMIKQLAAQKGVKLIDYLIEYPFHMGAGEDYASFKAMIKDKIRHLNAGISELYVHPSVESEEIKRVNPSWEKRVYEYRVFYEDDVQNVIREEGIELIPWSYVRR